MWHVGRRLAYPVLVLALALLAGGGAPSLAATSPPSLMIEVIGSGTVSGSGIACGGGRLACYAVYGTDPAAVTLTESPASGWAFNHWEDGGTACSSGTSCPLSLTGDNTVTAVFTTAGAVGSATFGVTVSQNGATPTTHGQVADNSTNYPIACGTGASPQQCSLTVLAGSTLTVVEQPDTGSVFSQWGGACSGTSVSCSAHLATNQSVSADFVQPTTNTLTVNVVGGGSVSGGGVSCPAGSICAVEEPSNATVTLTASPQSGYAFTGWSDDCSGLQPSCTVQMNSARKVTATFELLVPLLVTVNGTGQVSGAGITCGPGPQSCSAAVAPNSTVQLTATPANGVGVAWSGCTSSAGPICSVQVASSPISVTATFSGGTSPPSTFALSASVTGDGYVITSGSADIYCTAAGGAGCTASEQQDVSVTLIAVPASGSASDFVGWSGGCASSSTSCTLVMNSAKTVHTAFVGTSTTYTLTAALTGSGSGAISGAGLHCNGTGTPGCSQAQAANAPVTVTATPGIGSTFAGWSGACTGTNTTCNVRMTAAQGVTATFNRAVPGQQTLTVTVLGRGRVKGDGQDCVGDVGKAKSCSKDYATGTAVTLNATPGPGFFFGGWKDACSGKKATCTVTISTATNVEATFERAYLAAARRPVVSAVPSGYRVTLFYYAGERGTLQLVATRAGLKVLATQKATPPGAGTIAAVVKRPGRYVLTITLISTSGRHSLHWVVVV
jgi:hypothetical protein